MSERFTQPRPPRQPAHVYRSRRLRVAAGAAGVLAAVSGAVAVSRVDGSTPTENRGARAELNFLNQPQAVDNSRLTLHSGVNLRHTPVRSNADPEAGVSGNRVDFEIPEGATLNVNYPLVIRDKDGSGVWYGFTLPNTVRSDVEDPEDATVWVDLNSLRVEEAEAADRGTPRNYYDIEQIRPLGMDMSDYTVRYDPSTAAYEVSGLDSSSPQSPTTLLINRPVAAAVLVQQ